MRGEEGPYWINSRPATLTVTALGHLASAGRGVFWRTVDMLFPAPAVPGQPLSSEIPEGEWTVNRDYQVSADAMTVTFGTGEKQDA